MKKYLILPLLLSFFFSCSDDSSDNNGEIIEQDRRVFVDGGQDVGIVEDMKADASQPDLGPSDMADSGFEKTALFEPGPHNIGYRNLSFQYTTVDQMDRTLRVAVWYPTADTEGKNARYYNLINRPGIFLDASIVDDTFPVVVFSHGNSGFGEQSFFLAEFLTSHGYVVVAPDHTGNTFQEGGADLAVVTAFRPQDISATLDFLEALPPEDPLFGKLSDKIAMSGHSFGGYTTLAVSGATFDVDAILAGCPGVTPAQICTFLNDGGSDIFRAGFHDPRFKAAIPMAPAGAGLFQMGVSAIDIPTLLFTGGQDRTLPNAREGDPIWAQFSAPATRINILKAGHFTFTNICLLAGTQQPFKDDGCSDAFIPSEEAFSIVNAYSLAFLEKHLFGKTEHDAFLASSGGFALDLLLETK